MRLVAQDLGHQNVGDLARDAEGETGAHTRRAHRGHGRGRVRTVALGPEMADARGERDARRARIYKYAEVTMDRVECSAAPCR